MMSTRCNITIIDKDLNTLSLYHHHDGYPDGVGIDLVKKVKALNKNFSTDTDEFATALIKDKDDDEYELSTSGRHGDEEYLYQVNLDKREVYIITIEGNLINVEDYIKEKQQ